jgi:hypothetical protein
MVTQLNPVEDIKPTLFGYRQPNLIFASTNQVYTEAGLNGTSGNSVVIFPDGSIRINVSVPNGQSTMTITQVAVLSGSKQGGLRTGTVANNTWYAVYAVKSTDDVTTFVPVAEPTLCIPANYATLNGFWGAGNWKYLGNVRYGDNSGTANAILAFVQNGNYTILSNVETDLSGNGGLGMRLVASASSPATYTYSAGNSGTAIPNNLSIVTLWTASGNGGAAAEFTATNSGNSQRYVDVSAATGNRIVQQFNLPIAQLGGLRIASNSPGSGLDINLSGWFDGALGGFVPLL